MFDHLTTRRAAALAALFIAGGALAWTGYHTRRTEPQTAGQFRRDTLEILTSTGSRTFDIELAVSIAEQAQGLMYRTSLADTHGMLFLHSRPGEVRMWMHNTYIPLDMVFIRADGTVHRIERGAEPLSDHVIYSQGPVSAVLEMAGGATERLGLKPGDRIRHPLFGGR